MIAKAAPKYPDLVFPTLLVIKNKGGSASIDEIEDGVADLLGLTDEVLSIPHGETGRSEFQYKLAWVRTYLKKAGALTNSERGVWATTDAGERISEKEARTVFKRAQAGHSKARKAEPEEDAKLDVVWSEQLLEVLRKIDPGAFERLSQRLLRESGFTKVEVTGRSGDGGIDGIGVLRMNLVSFQVLFQCKRWKGSVGASVVRDFRGAMVGRADKGFIITTGSFTAEARREATRDGAPAIDLIDGETLCVLLKDRKLGVAVRLVEDVTVDELFFRSV